MVSLNLANTWNPQIALDSRVIHHSNRDVISICRTHIGRSLFIFFFLYFFKITDMCLNLFSPLYFIPVIKNQCSFSGWSELYKTWRVGRLTLWHRITRYRWNDHQEGPEFEPRIFSGCGHQLETLSEEHRCSLEFHYALKWPKKQLFWMFCFMFSITSTYLRG